MSYDLAVWEGERPSTTKALAAKYEELMAYLEADDSSAPTLRIRAYVEALLRRWPDITTDEGEDSPWSTGPLLGEASGSMIYFPLRWSMADEASAFAAQLAEEHGLVCYDPQMDSLRP
ncbi:hypothetical protein AB0B89_20825 [Sphaerisporangium sp. NPDC049002]|uniref:hypothetical protein n=1 Tax=Sphaerisporangium sp. NPDC049002 TaxID=3155392 RepID=UPI0034027526